MINLDKEIKQLVAAAENQLDIILNVHKKNISNGSADPDEFDELYETAVENVSLLKQIEKQIAVNGLLG